MQANRTLRRFRFKVWGWGPGLLRVQPTANGCGALGGGFHNEDYDMLRFVVGSLFCGRHHFGNLPNCLALAAKVSANFRLACSL